MRIGRGFTGREHSRGGGPSSPSTGLRFFADAVSGGYHHPVAGSSSRSCLSPWDGFPRGNRCNAPGGGGGPAKTVHRETHETGEGGCSTPSPSAPPPRGDIPSMHCLGRASPRLDVNTLPKSCLCPLARPSGQSPHTARPLPGGREVGVIQRKPFNGRRMRQGRGMFHPRPGEPHPHGVIPHGCTAGEEHLHGLM